MSFLLVTKRDHVPFNKSVDAYLPHKQYLRYAVDSSDDLIIIIRQASDLLSFTNLFVVTVTVPSFVSMKTKRFYHQFASNLRRFKSLFSFLIDGEWRYFKNCFKIC